MFPQIPENLAALSLEALQTFVSEVREAVLVLNASEDATPDDYVTANVAIKARKQALALIAAKEAAAEVVAETDETDETDLADDADETDEDTDESDLADDADADDDDDEGDLSDKTPVRVKTTTSLGTTEDEDTGRGGAITPDRLIAYGGVSGQKADTQFESWGDLAAALVEVGASVSPGSNQKVNVAKIPGTFSEDQILGENMLLNLRRFEPELMAALCAPTVNTYDLSCWNTDRRPVRSSLAQFKPDARGSVSIFPSPTLSDIVSQAPAGVGTWDSDDDDSIGGTNPSSKACAVITCGSPTVYSLYGVWRCITIQNLLAMTFPELVEAWLNRLAAYHARVAELQLLEAMATNAVAVNATAGTFAGDGYGAAVTVTSSVLNMLALHQESERWDLGEADVWLPRWVQSAMKLDIMRRRNTSGSIDVPSDERINQMFRDVGVEPYWFIDSPTWATAIPAVHTAGNMNALPANVEMIVAPRGKFAVMDRGELNIGVTGNGMYRDNASNAGNNFTMFFENFEGLVDTDSCPAHILSIDGLCYNGRQIDDVAIDCDGGLTGT